MLLSTVIEQLLGGMITSIEIFLLTLLFSLPLGLLIAGGRMSKFGPLRWLMKLYISIMRGTPLMLQLIVVFFAPYYLFGISLSSDFRFISSRNRRSRCLTGKSSGSCFVQSWRCRKNTERFCTFFTMRNCLYRKQRNC